jgi:hypothetical protein
MVARDLELVSWEPCGYVAEVRRRVIAYSRGGSETRPPTMLHWTSVRDPNRANAPLVRNTLRLSQEFFEGLPVVFVPAGEQVLRVAVGKTAVIERELGVGAAFGEFEFYD